MGEKEYSKDEKRITDREYELVHELMEIRAEREKELQYEELKDYDVPPRSQFSMYRKPALTIKAGQLLFNMACIRLFKDVQYILPIVHEGKHRIAVIPCQEEESCSIDWARKNGKGVWKNKIISNRTLVGKIGEFMKWDRNCRYRVLGELRMSERGLILVFELDEAIMLSSELFEIENTEGGEKSFRRKETKYYPDRYKERVGLAYSDYAAGRQLDLFEDFSSYFQTGYDSLAPEEPNRDTNSATDGKYADAF